MKLFRSKGPLGDPVTRPILKSLFWDDSFLNNSGWFESVRRALPVDKNGKILPWWTYSAIAFLEPRLKGDMVAFEYGSGHSTIWMSRRLAKVTSCEHDRAWHERIKPSLPANVDYRLSESVESGGYADEILSAPGADIVVIDGSDRVGCARRVVSMIAPRGVVLWDNSDRTEYSSGYQILIEAGFKRLDFWGMGPINRYGWCTSIFYRPQNCLDI